MSDEKTLNEIELFGVNVEIMGCVPPYKNSKTYLFQCKSCKHEWFEYEEEEENFFEFLYETYPGPPSPKIIYDGGFIYLSHNESFSYLRIPNDKETKTFWRKIDEFNIWSWRKRYADDSVLDGFGWELNIKRTKKRKIKIKGYNSYPRNKKFFKNFLECINEFAGWDYEI